MFIKGSLIGILCSAFTAGATQSFLGLENQNVKWFAPPYTAPYNQRVNDGLFTPVEHLGALSETQFTTLSHPVFPNYSVRIKKSSDFCDTTVKSVRFPDSYSSDYDTGLT